MKKILLLAAALMVSTGAFAQFQWGVKAGLNLANATNMDDAKMRPGLYAGAFAEYGVSEFLGVQAELLYSMQGSMMKEGDVKDVMKFDYLNLPVLAKLYVLEGLSVDLGPQFGYLLSAKNKISGAEEVDLGGGETFDPNGTNNLYDTDGLKKFDISFAAGLSYKIAGKFDVSARYNLGLTKVSDEDKTKNSVISVGVGYRF